MPSTRNRAPRRAAALLASTLGSAAVVAAGTLPPPASRRPPTFRDPTNLEALARETFDRLLRVVPISGPRPELVVTIDGRPRASTDDRATVNVSLRMLRLCFAVEPALAARAHEVGGARVAFVLAHELAHVSRRDVGSFESRAASAVVEMDADERAVVALVTAGFDPDDLRLEGLFARIDRDLGGLPSGSHPATRARVANVRRLKRDVAARAPEWQLGWLLAVSGRFDQARDLLRTFAARYPSPAAMHALALTRVLAAWRTAPCGDAPVVAWYPPIRYDPRAQTAPYAVRTAGGACDEFYRQLELAAGELEQAQGYAPAQVALGAVRLLQSRPTLDPTRDGGGVTQVAVPCPEAGREGHRTEAEQSLVADACHVSLLAQYELAGRSEPSRLVARDGLLRLLQRWPGEPSLSFNLARLLAPEGAAAAAPHWAAFLAAAGPGRHAEIARAALPATTPAHPDAPAPAGVASSTSRLEAGSHRCRRPDGWRAPVSSSAGSLLFCGSWRDELILKNRAGSLVRTLARASNAWPSTQAPAAAPAFVTFGVTGDELRVWDEEAWVFRDGAPQRVVYFRKPQ